MGEGKLQFKERHNFHIFPFNSLPFLNFPQKYPVMVSHA
jgi:hypothetical protein